MLKGHLSRASLGRVHAAARSKMYIVHATRGMQVTLWWLQKRKKNQTHAPSSRRFPENLFSQLFLLLHFETDLKNPGRIKSGKLRSVFCQAREASSNLCKTGDGHAHINISISCDVCGSSIVTWCFSSLCLATLLRFFSFTKGNMPASNNARRCPARSSSFGPFAQAACCVGAEWVKRSRFDGAHPGASVPTSARIGLPESRVKTRT